MGKSICRWCCTRQFARSPSIIFTKSYFSNINKKSFRFPKKLLQHFEKNKSFKIHLFVIYFLKIKYLFSNSHKKLPFLKISKRKPIFFVNKHCNIILKRKTYFFFKTKYSNILRIKQMLENTFVFYLFSKTKQNV
jgi:hypothetical protein